MLQTSADVKADADANDYNQHSRGENAIAVNTKSRYKQSHCAKWTPWQSILCFD